MHLKKRSVFGWAKKGALSQGVAYFETFGTRFGWAMLLGGCLFVAALLSLSIIFLQVL